MLEPPKQKAAPAAATFMNSLRVMSSSMAFTFLFVTVQTLPSVLGFSFFGHVSKMLLHFKTAGNCPLAL